MAKTIPSALQTHLNSEVTTLATLLTITRADGVVVRLTDLDADLVVGGDTYKATFGYLRSALSIREGLTADDVEITGLIQSGFVSKADVSAGLYDGAELKISAVNFNSPSDGEVVLKRGLVGEVLLASSDRFSIELRSLAGRLGQEILEKTSPTCRAELGDARCTVPVAPLLRANTTAYSLGQFIRVATTSGTGDQVYENRIYECTTAGTSGSSAPTFNTTVGATTADGSVTWTAREAWTRSATVASVSSGQVFTLNITESRAVDEWFDLGSVAFQSGSNINRVFEVKAWNQGSAQVTLFLPAPFTISVGDVVSIVPGCDKRRATCRAKFALAGSANFANGNVINFRGEPDLPGRDAVLTYPDAQ